MPLGAETTNRPLLLALSGVLFLGAVVAGGVWWLDRGSDDPQSDEWDFRIEGLVEFVEKERGLEFKHAVAVDFLSEKEFRKEVTSEESELTGEEKKEIRHTEGLLRALGLIDHQVDLLEAVNAAHGGGVVGLYDPEDERIRMRGEKLTPAARSTLVHELTHVLQDQHFDLEAKDEELEDADDAAGAIWDALIEGDASRIATAYEADQSEAEQRKLTEDQKREGVEIDKQLQGVPPFLQTVLGAPYVFGEQLLALVVEVEGDDAVDDLFAEPPATEEHLLDPWTLLDDERALEVDAPDLNDGEKEFDAGTFGAPSLMFMLAERVAPKQALAVADGWGGDQYVAFERGDRACIRIDYRGDTPRDVTELRVALDEWILEGPAGTASVRDHDRGLRFESCDPGAAAVGGTGGSIDALTLAIGRTAIATQVIQEGLPEQMARCYAAAIFRKFSQADLTRLNSAKEPDPADVAVLQRLAAGCR